MGGIEQRRSYTSKGTHSFNPWNRSDATYSICMINLGNNSISRLEIVSSLNLIKIGYYNYYYYSTYCASKYNPKLYLGAIQTVSEAWNADYQTGQTNELPAPEKSGSC